eukprot:53027-Rhodomonas_salina.1
MTTCEAHVQGGRRPAKCNRYKFVTVSNSRSVLVQAGNAWKPAWVARQGAEEERGGVRVEGVRGMRVVKPVLTI